MSAVPSSGSLRKTDWALLTGFCLLLFGFSMVSGRPLSMHEAVLPESAHEMLHDLDFVVPKKGGEPWLESPPLPQWLTVALAAPFGRCDTHAIARLGPTLAATAIVLLVTWMTTLWFERPVALLTGFVLATTCEFTRYAWLAEDEIFLCLLVTAALVTFAAIECGNRSWKRSFQSADRSRADGEGAGLSDSSRSTGVSPEEDLRFFGRRPWAVTLFFFLLGLTNLAKGPLFGTVIVATAAGGFLLWNADWSRVRRYVWFWGWLLFLALAVAWPLAAYRRYPDVLDLWLFDFGGRLSGQYEAINEPWWYYPVNLLWMLAPWTVVIPLGLKQTADKAWRHRGSPERFLWCWALLVPFVYSIPHGKHHHYMLHALAPWAPLAALGVLELRQRLLRIPDWMKHPAWSLLTLALPAVVALILLRDRLPNPLWLTWTVVAVCPFLALLIGWGTNHRRDFVAGATLFGVLGVGYAFGHWYAGRYVDKHRLDAAFLQQLADLVPKDKPLVLDMSIGAHRSFLCLFYLDDSTIPIHNLSFLRDDRITSDEAYVVTRWGNRDQLSQVGAWQLLAESLPGYRQRPKPDRLCLFRLKYHDSTRISSQGIRVSPMQAIDRVAGPFLDPRRRE